MKPIWTLDMETDPFKAGRIPRPFLTGIYTGSEYYEFDHREKSLADLVKFLCTKEVRVYAHNGGKFDYHFLLPWLSEFSELDIINGRLARFSIGLCEFRDSWNILPVPLSQYKKDEIDYGIMEESERYKPENWAKIRDYLKNDCRYLHDAVSQFVEKFGCHLTIATASMKQWQKRTGRIAPKSDKEYYEFFSQFYYGGRVQCFEYGEINDTFSVVDINSAYPYAMLFPHPIGLDYMEIDDPEMIRGDMFVELDCIAEGCFPYRAKDGLYFPDDNERRRYTVTGWEYLAAMEHAAIRDVEIHHIYNFHELTDFSDYILHFYAERKEAKKKGDDAMSLFAKLFMNSLYGKFAANPEKYSRFEICAPEHLAELEKHNMEFGGTLGPWILGRRVLNESEQRYYNVATAASITGFVRAHLYRAMKRCRGVIYCDTDSIVARDVGNLKYGPELGEWELEGVMNKGYFAGRKLYAMRYRDPIYKESQKIEWKTAAKGVRATVAEIRAAALGDVVRIEPETPTFSVFRAPAFVPRNIRKTKKVLKKA